jgi:hemoglobin
MPDETEIASVYKQIGEEGFTRLIAAFYRQIPHDELLGPLYPQADLEGAEQRLRGFLAFRFGGPDYYIHQRGHPMLRARHAPFVIDQARRDRWVSLMDKAFAEADLPASAVAIIKPFLHDVATFLINRNNEPQLTI